ncbi:MAG: hypothetical protein AAF418_01390 [Pseudomonadota bacterium]
MIFSHFFWPIKGYTRTIPLKSDALEERIKMAAMEHEMMHARNVNHAMSIM